MRVPGHVRWQHLSPLLDELLDLPAPARALRLAALRDQDAALAAEAAALLEGAEGADAARFLAGSVSDVIPPVVAAAATLQGQCIGPYAIEEPLGHGGSGSVWRAHRTDDPQASRVAVKLLHLSLLDTGGAQRFEREGTILAQLAHPNIARLLDAGVTPGGQPYLVIELIDGLRIDEHCDQQQLGVGQRLALFDDVLGAVAHAHSHGIIHRDIKPTNILVSTEGVVKLLDFGIAKLLQHGRRHSDAAPITAEGDRALTPQYAAPEQWLGQSVTTATDVYALGVLLYELLAGTHPTAPPQATSGEVMRATLDTAPRRLSRAVTIDYQVDEHAPLRIAAARATSPRRLRRQLAGDLENIVARCLNKAAEQRYATVAALGDDLRRYRANEPVTARADTIGYRASRFVARHRGAVFAAMLTGAAIVAGVVGTVSQAHRANLEAQAARRERDAALEQQRLLRGNNEFLQLLMRDAAGGEPGTIRRQLDRAVVLLDKTRFEHPIVKVALLRQTAARYTEVGDVKQALSLIEQAIASIDGTELALPASAVPVNLACSLAYYRYEVDQLLPALAALDRADRLMAAGAALSAPSRIECRMRRSLVELALGHFERGLVLSREALRSLEEAGLRDGEQHRIARSNLAQALLASGRNAEGLAIAAPLLAESQAGQGRESMAVIYRSSLVTSLRRAGGEPLEALALSEADEASAAHLLGAEHDASIDLERGRVLLAMDRFAEAATVLRRAAATASGQQDLRRVLPAELAAVEALARSGQVGPARDLFAAAAARRSLAANEERPEQIDVLRVEALLAAARNDGPGARQALDRARGLVDAAGGDAHPAAWGVAMARAEAALKASRIEPARAECERALNAARRSAIDAARSSDVGRALALRARIALDTGRRTDALADAAAALAHLEPTLGPTHAETRAALQIQARAR